VPLLPSLGADIGPQEGIDPALVALALPFEPVEDKAERRGGSGGNRRRLFRSAIRSSGPSVQTRGYVGSWAGRSLTAHSRTKPAIWE
jgi:hypothetical protein